MSFPKWITPAGDLGVIPELEYYQKDLDAYSATAGTITFSLVSGQLPTGLQIQPTGRISGIPVAPREGDQNVEYRFSVRATHSAGGVADRTFLITITNIAPPVITPKQGDKFLNIIGTSITANAGSYILQPVTGANAFITQNVISSTRIPIARTTISNFVVGSGNLKVNGVDISAYPSFIESSDYNLGDFFDGTIVNYQLNAVEFLPGRAIEWTVIGGSLPPGLSLSSTGVIVGYVEKIVADSPIGTPEWDVLPWDTVYSGTALGWDFDARSVSKNFTFTVQAYDGVNYDIVTYRINVLSKSGITADSTLVTADTTILYYDAFGIPVGLLISSGSLHDPIMLSGTGILPTQTQGTYLAYKFNAIDIDGDVIQYASPSTANAGYDFLANAVNSTIYVSAPIVNGNLSINTAGDEGAEGFGSTLPPDTDIKFLNASNKWASGVIDYHATIGFQSNVNVNVGDIITQSLSGANATVTGNVIFGDYGIANVYYNSTTSFIFGSIAGNISINGAPPNSNYPIDCRAVGVDVSGSGLTPEGTSGYDITLYDQGVQNVLTGFTLDPNTGWLYGNLPVSTQSVNSYNFSVFAYKRDNPGYKSAIENFSITVLSEFINWETPSILGTLQNGELCDFKVTANDPQGRRLIYTLDAVSTSYNNPGSGAEAEAVIDPITGELLRVTILQQGSGYTYAPIVTVLSSTGTNAQCIAAISDGKVVSINVVSSGQDYVSGATTIKFDGIGNRLPQGLRLYNDGTIQGRVTFQLFSLDSDVITFDNGTTTFDRDYVFTVMASDIQNNVDTMKTFKITLINRNDAPYENLYLRAMPSRDQRESFTQLIENPEIFPADQIYRKDDPNFGVANELKFLFLPGLNASSLAEYISAIGTNHFRKRLTFGEIKTAVAVDDNFEPQYEVVYVEVVDMSANESGENAKNSINLSSTITNPFLYGNGSYTVANPNGFLNMESQIINTIGYENKGALPKWMTSNQPNPENPDQFLGPLGFTRAVVLCYTTAGSSSTIAYRIKNSGFNLNTVDFDIDRYYVDNLLSTYYDTATNSWLTSRETTFDRYPILPSFYTDKGVVDYAVSIPFDSIYNKTVEDIQANGGLDGVVDFQNGDKLVFFVQEFTPIYNTTSIGDYNYGWAKVYELWDQYAFDTTSNPNWDPATVVPGFNENIVNTSIRNERISIWTISIVNNRVILTSTTEIEYYDKIFVRNGSNYGGTNIYYDPTVQPNKTIPSWQAIPQQISTVYTTFDGNGTRFFNNKDSYANPGQGDKYISYPRIGVFT